MPKLLFKLFQLSAYLMLLMALCILPAAAQTSAPVQAPAAIGGHWYEVIPTNGVMSWSQARDAALAKGGYLVSITSSDENSFVLNQLPLPGVGAFMGGLEASPGNWTWLSGDSWALYNNWNAGEPNFVTPPEREVATELYTNNSVSPRLPGYWNNIAPSHVSTEFRRTLSNITRTRPRQAVFPKVSRIATGSRAGPFGMAIRTAYRTRSTRETMRFGCTGMVPDAEAACTRQISGVATVRIALGSARSGRLPNLASM
jgi:hypothetical protein